GDGCGNEGRKRGGAGRRREAPAGRQRSAAVEDADVVEAQEAALEGVVAGPVLAVPPPGEIERELVESGFEPVDVGSAAPLVQTVGEDGGPGVYRRAGTAPAPPAPP